MQPAIVLLPHGFICGNLMVVCVFVKFCSGIRDQQPLAIAAGATQQPFANASLKHGLSSGAGYKAGGSLWWLNMHACTDAMIPISQKQVNVLQAHYFAVPAMITRDIVVRVKEGEIANTFKGPCCTQH